MDEGHNEVVSNVDIAVYALAKAGGATRTVHSEHVAAKCFQIAPLRFAWRLPEYRDKWPDKEVVRSALVDGSKKKYGGLVSGDYARDLSRDGWRLTPAGVEWFKENEERLARVFGKEPTGLFGLEAKRFLRKIKKSSAFKCYEKTRSIEGVSIYMFADMLECAPDASNRIVKQQYERFLSSASLASDEEVVGFLSKCGEVFSEVMTEE